MSDNVKKVLIIYASEEEKTLQELKEQLEQQGCEVIFISIDMLQPEEPKDLDWAEALVVLISSQTGTNENVDQGIEYMEKKNKRIVGVWAPGSGESDRPKNLKLYANAIVECQGDRVLDAINGEINICYNPDGQEQPEQNIKRHNC